MSNDKVVESFDAATLKSEGLRSVRLFCPWLIVMIFVGTQFMSNEFRYMSRFTRMAYVRIVSVPLVTSVSLARRLDFVTFSGEGYDVCEIVLHQLQL